jgi:hypothetical protein
MPIRSLILGFTLFLLVLPLLCLAGVGGHECVCGDNMCCEESESCDIDPCNQRATMRMEFDLDEPVSAPDNFTPHLTLVSCPASPCTHRPKSADSLRLPGAAIIHPILV